jgi:hypothetical protein
MKLRNIPEGMAEEIVLQSNEYYQDIETGYLIAVKPVSLQGKNRNVAVTFERRGDKLILITLHPLKKGQKENRIKSKRWVRHEDSL